MRPVNYITTVYIWSWLKFEVDFWKTTSPVMKISAIETADAKLECLSLVGFIDMSIITEEG